MKSQLIKLVLLFILLISSTILQEIYPQVKPMWYGVKGGWNYSFTNVEIGGLNVQGRHGLHAGAVFEYWISDLFAIHSNALYNMKGNMWERDLGFFGTVEYKWAFDYLSFPILAKFAFGDKVKFYVIVGPEFSFLLSGNEVKEGEAWEYAGEITGETDIKEYMNSFEFAANLGFGVDIHADPVVIFIEIHGSLGLTDILKETPPGLFIEEGAVRHLVPSISAGVLF
jgi:hypothetical protein